MRIVLYFRKGALSNMTTMNNVISFLFFRSFPRAVEMVFKLTILTSIFYPPFSINSCTDLFFLFCLSLLLSPRTVILSLFPLI